MRGEEVIKTDEKKEMSSLVWSVASTLLSRGAGVIFTPIFTRLLTPSEFGVYSLYTSVMGIFTVICTLEISGSAIYKGFAAFDGESADGFTSAAIGAEMLLTLISLSLYMLLKRHIDRFTGLGGVLPLVLIAQIFLTAVIGIYIARLRYRGRFKAVALINGIQGLLSPPLALLFILLGIRERGRIYAQLIVTAGIGAFILFKTVKRSGALISGRIWKYLFKLLVPMLPHYVASSALAQADKIIVARRLGEGAVGKYAAAFSIGHLPSLFTGGIALALTPYMIRRLKKGDGREVEDTVRRAIGFSTLVVLIFLTLLPEAFRIFADKEYYDALPVAYATALGIIFSFSATLINSALLYYAKTVVITKNTLITAVISLPVSYFLADKVGYTGVALSSAVSYVLLLALSYRSLRRYAPEKMIVASSYLPIYTTATAVAVLIFLLRPLFFARFILFLAIFLILLAELIRAFRKRRAAQK